MATLQTESTEYVYVGVTGDAPAMGAEVAFMSAGERPGEDDWHEAVLVDSSHVLYSDAVASGASGDYYVAVLVGGYGDNDVNPGVGDYQVFVRLTDVTERPVRIAPSALEIEG